MPGYAGLLASGPEVDSQDLRLRIDYTMPMAGFHLRPSFTLDGVRVHSGSTQETGLQQVLALDYEDAEQISAVATPLLEIGTQYPVGPATSFSITFTGGISIPSETRFLQNVRFHTAGNTVEDFTATGPMPGKTGRIGFSLQLLSGKNATLKATFEEAIAGLSNSQIGALEAAWRF